MANKNRGSIVNHGQTIDLTVVFKDSSDSEIDTDSFPSVSIIEPSGNVALAPTSVGVYRLSTGTYGYSYAVGLNNAVGIWTDRWTASISGNQVAAAFSFIIADTELPGSSYSLGDGYESLGDDIGYTYSQTAIHNINKLLKALKNRLASSGMKLSVDANGNTFYQACDVFSVDQLVTFLADALSRFNSIPHTTAFTFDDSEFVSLYLSELVQCAVYQALATMAILERGREFSITDNSINFTPPGVSDILSSEYGIEIANWTDIVKLIKASMKPSPLSLGTISISVARNPVISQLRHRRSRQII